MTERLERTELTGMGAELFDELIEFEKLATPGPWHLRWFDDNLCRNGYAISSVDGGGYHEEDLFSGDWNPSEMIAGTLLQSPAAVVPKDGHAYPNSILIALMRNHASELIRLAKIGWEFEQGQAAD